MIKKFYIFLLLLAWASPAQALSVRHFFTAFIGPFNASTAEFEYQLSPKTYQVNSVIRTNGTFDTLYPFEAKYATTGKIIKDKMQTASYEYHSKSRFTKRSKQTFYDSRGHPLYSISTKNAKSKRREIDATAAGNATDLQTILAIVAKRYNEVRFCAARLPVFDGKRRYDVILEDEGKEEIVANQYSPFAGPAVKCSMYIDKLQSEGDDLLWQLTSDRPIHFWIMEDTASSAPFIARIKIKETPLGKMDVYTTKIEVKK